MKKKAINLEAEQNLYRFCTNNPINRIDKFGLDVTWGWVPPTSNLNYRFIQRVVGGTNWNYTAMMEASEAFTVVGIMAAATPLMSASPFFDGNTADGSVGGLLSGAPPPYYRADWIGWGGGPNNMTFEDDPSGQFGHTPAFETCVASVDPKSGKIKCLGPCKNWNYGFNGYLDSKLDRDPSSDFKAQLHSQYSKLY